MTYHAMWTDTEWAAARAISIRQPWAWSVAMLAIDPDAKGVENRSSGFPKGYTGPLLIHAALQPSPRGLADLRVQRIAVKHPEAIGAALIRGHVLAVADLVDVHPDGDCCRPWGESEYVGSDQQLHRGVTHLVLENVVQLAEPVKARGALGLWRPQADVLAEVGHQMCRGRG